MRIILDERLKDASFFSALQGTLQQFSCEQIVMLLTDKFRPAKEDVVIGRDLPIKKTGHYILFSKCETILDNLFQVNEESWHDVVNIITMLRTLTVPEEIPAWHKNYKQLRVVADNFVKNCSDGSFEKLCMRLLQLREKIWGIYDQQTIFEMIRTFIGEDNIVFSCDLYESGKSRGEIFALPSFVDKYLQIEFAKDSPASAFYVVCLIEFIDQYYCQKDGEYQDETIWEQAFSRIPFPLAVVTEDGELLLHNADFAKLKILPRECLKLKNNEQFERAGTVYQVTREQITDQRPSCYYFMFSGHSSPGRNISSSELGIISSSIAHELNNPIAGILAALTLLRLEDDLTADQEGILDEMEKAARRCQRLVEIFLGFSKTNAKQATDVALIDVFNQALSLLRFRMAETNIFVEVRSTVGEQYLRDDINVAVFVMIFYLLLSEMLTEFAHYKLVSSDRERNNAIAIDFHEDSSHLQLSFSPPLDLDELIGKSKLINYLFEVEQLQSKCGPGVVALFWNVGR